LVVWGGPDHCKQGIKAQGSLTFLNYLAA